MVENYFTSGGFTSGGFTSLSLFFSTLGISVRGKPLSLFIPFSLSTPHPEMKVETTIPIRKFILNLFN